MNTHHLPTFFAIARFSTIFLMLSILSLLLFAGEIPPKEYAERRQNVMRQLDDGLLVLHARSGVKEMEQPGWVQDASFFYFTGMQRLPDAILVIDGPEKAAVLFVPPVTKSFGITVPQFQLQPGKNTAKQYFLDSVLPWADFVGYVRERLQQGVSRIYIDDARRRGPTGVPEGMAAIAGDKMLWKQSLKESFPGAELISAEPTIRKMRWAKTPAEIKILRKNAVITAEALITGIRRIRPGISQRQAEAAVVTACMENGAQGPSFWPWMMSGPNSVFGKVVGSFYDYDHLNRIMQAGELVRVDVGCGGGGYGGDVGRTVPVSGEFTEIQGAVWGLMVAGYQGGLSVMKAGVSLTAVEQAAKKAVQAQAAGSNDLAKTIGRQMLDEKNGVLWHIHGVGIESGEAPVDTLMIGTILAFEPMFTYQKQGYFLEDMILINADGFEVLSNGLPYSAAEIEALMQQ